MQEELLQFKLQKVWILVDLPYGKRAIVYQMDVKSAFLYGTIEEEVYICQPPGFEDPEYPDKVYKVVKALYGLHQAPRDWYETLATYLLENRFQRGTIDQTLFIKKQQKDILLVQIYVDDIIFGLQVKQTKDGIFISQDKYVAEILRKFGLSEGKLASTPIDAEKPLLKDSDGEDVDKNTYRSIIGSLMYLTSSRPYIMFAVCACARFQVTPKISHLNAVKRIFKYLKGKPCLGLWYPKDSPFNLVAYSDSDYAGASLDRKSTTGGCQFLGCRLISWQCKKQTIVATSSTEAEYVAAASGCAQVLWMQNQLLDYGYNFMHTKSDAAEGFEKIIDFLSGSYIHYALTVSPLIYISCIKQFWNSVSVKRSGDVTRLQALVDKKKIVISKAVIRKILQLNDAEGVVCLPNEEIFAGLAQMGTSWNEFSTAMASAVICLSKGQRFNFSKYIFDSLVRNVDSSSKFYMYPCFIQLVIQTNIADLSTHTTIYISLALTQKVFANMRRVGKGFSGVETPLFEKEVVLEVVPPTPMSSSPPSPVIPSSPPHQPPCPPQPQDAEGLSLLFQQVLATCSALALRVEGLENDKAAQQLKKVGSSQRVESSDDMENVFNPGRMIVDMNHAEGIELVVDQEKDAEFEGRHADKQAEIYNIDLDHSSKVLSMQEDDTEVQETVEIVITAKLMTEVVTAAATQVAAANTPIPVVKPKILTITAALAVSTRRRKGVVIRDPEEELPSDTLGETPKVKDKGKGILIESPKPMKKKDQIEMDAEYHGMKKKPQTESEARKNMIFYLKNTEGYKMDIFKGKKYDEILLIFQAKFDANMRFLFKSREEMEAEDEEIIKSINETPAQKAAKRRKLSEEAHEAEDLRKILEIVQDEDDDVFVEATLLAQNVPVVDYQIVVIDNKPEYKIKRADDTHQLYISFTTLLKNFNREDLKALWRIVRDKFSTSKPTNFLDEYLLLTLKTMFEEPDGQDAIWRNQKSVHGLALVKRRKLLTSCELMLPSKSKDCQSNIDAASLKLKLFKNITAVEEMSK
nr:putative ribonuclease H-like domain-containing protein [Tanacetum cinerariifolium]